MKLTVYIFLSFLLAGCDIFETRYAEPPDQSGSNYPPAIEPLTVISNMINSFKYKDVVSYLNTIVGDNSDNDFVYIPSSSAFGKYSGIWEDWNANSENQYYKNVVASIPDELPITLTLSTSSESFSYSGDSYLYISDYLISIPQTSGDNLIFAGNLEFKMININTVWKIYYWKDNAIEDMSSWSDLKGLYHY